MLRAIRASPLGKLLPVFSHRVRHRQSSWSCSGGTWRVSKAVAFSGLCLIRTPNGFRPQFAKRVEPTLAEIQSLTQERGSSSCISTNDLVVPQSGVASLLKRLCMLPSSIERISQRRALNGRTIEAALTLEGSSSSIRQHPRSASCAGAISGACGCSAKRRTEPVNLPGLFVSASCADPGRR